MSWHVTSFEERLETALSEEKLLSERSVGFFWTTTTTTKPLFELYIIFYYHQVMYSSNVITFFAHCCNRNCSSGKTSQFLGVEGEETDTAESNRLYATAYAWQFFLPRVTEAFSIMVFCYHPPDWWHLHSPISLCPLVGSIRMWCFSLCVTQLFKI